MPDFNGDTLRITLDPPIGGVLNLDFREVVYEGWKNWLLDNNSNLGYPTMFDVAGGDSLVAGVVNVGSYFFLRNDLGWRIISSDEDQTINYIGNLVGRSSTTPVIVPTPGRTVLHLGLQPVTLGLDAQIFTNITNAIFDNTMEDGESFAQAMRIMRAALAGDVDIVSGNILFKSKNGAITRIITPVDATGKRTGVITDGS